MNEDSKARKRLINPDLYEPIERYGEQSFEMKIGNTVFEIETHYNPQGRVSVMKQFQEYLLKNVDDSSFGEYPENTDAMPGCQKGEKRKLAQAEKRHDELDFLSKRVYEDNAFGKLPDDRYEKLKQSYEAEQKEIDKTISDLKANLAKTTRESEELRYLFDKLRDLSQVTELNPTLVNTLIKRIEIHDSEKRDGKTYVKVDIYFTAIGMFDIPSEKEINAVMKRMESEQETA